MIQIIRKLLDEIGLIWPFTSTPAPLTFTRVVEKFDAADQYLRPFKHKI